MNLNRCKLFPLCTFALVFLALKMPVLADDFVITSSDNSTNGVGTKNGATAADIGDTEINGSDMVSLGIALTTIGTTAGIKTTNVVATDDGNTIIISETGSITTTGDSAYGIFNYGDTNKTTNAGSITTTGNAGYGILNWGSFNETNVSEAGLIATTGKKAIGIYNYGDTNTTTISGNITATNNGGYGIYNRGDTNKTTLSGSISTTGNEVFGIYSHGNENTVTVSGSITATGESAYGIYNYGSRNTTIVSGSVMATGAESSAWYNFQGRENSLTLDEGATIIGNIMADDNSSGAMLNFNLGASTSYAYSISGKGVGTGPGQWTFRDLDGRSQVVTTSGTGCITISRANNDTCNLVTAVGAANAEVQNELQYIISRSLINSLPLDTPEKAAQQKTTATDVWFDAYGVSAERDISTWGKTGVVFNAHTRGLTIGKPFVLGEGISLDLVFNSSQTNLDIGTTKHQNIAVESFNFGVTMMDFAFSSNWYFDAFGFIGRNYYDGKRKVMNNQVFTGSETVTSSYSGTKALVGFNGNYTIPFNEAVSFKGGINANLSNEAIGPYSESKYSTWSARTLLQSATGISVGFTHKRDLLTTFATLEAEYSSLLKGEKSSYTNNSTATSYTDHDTSGDMISSVAVGFKYAGSNGVTFEGSIKGSSSNKGLSSASAKLGLNWSF